MVTENNVLDVPLDYEGKKKWLNRILDRHTITFIWSTDRNSIKEIVITGYKGNNIIIGVGDTFYGACCKLQERLERLKTVQLLQTEVVKE